MYLVLAVGAGQAASQLVWSRLVARSGLSSVYRRAALVLMAASLLFSLAITGGRGGFPAVRLCLRGWQRWCADGVMGLAGEDCCG